MLQLQLNVFNVFPIAIFAPTHLPHAQNAQMAITLMLLAHVHCVQLEQPLIYLSAINV